MELVKSEAAGAASEAYPSRRNILTIELVLLLSMFAVFAISPVRDMADSKYSMLVSENLLRNHSFEISKREVPRLLPFMVPGYMANGYPYQIDVVNGKLLYRYPSGSSVLSLPFVAVMNAAGVSAHTRYGGYNVRGDRYIQATIAALLMAILTVVFFRTALLVLPLTWSVVLALGGALSTQVWSTASRVLWSHTWQILLFGVVAYILLSEEKREAGGRPIALATLMSWAYFVRPTSSIPIAAITVYMLTFRRQEFVAYAITGASWLVLFLIYSWTTYGTLLPGYYRFHLSLKGLWIALPTNLVSPSRGLFIYVPSALFVLSLLAYYWRALPYRRLAVVCLGIITVQWVVISTDPNWWGGYCYGPRLTTDIVPWFFLVAVLAMRCLVDEGRPGLKRIAVTLGVLCLASGAFMNGRGAISDATSSWSPTRDVDRHPERVWNWFDPEFMAGLH
jgi:hypothetical protein